MNIVTLGTLHYPPNADGIRWFAMEVFPRISQEFPQATLTIIGKNPPQDFLELAANQPARFTVTGYVPDLVPQLERAAVMVVPVRAGSGMRVRILEALAQGMPIVTTTIGLEGIDAVPGEDVLVADTVEDYATAVARLLIDSELQTRLAVNGRRLAENRYDWRVVLKKMDEVYGDA
jgi:glycosyltransferase involved in cell wall biosynthesis